MVKVRNTSDGNMALGDATHLKKLRPGDEGDIYPFTDEYREFATKGLLLILDEEKLVEDKKPKRAEKAFKAKAASAAIIGGN